MASSRDGRAPSLCAEVGIAAELDEGRGEGQAADQRPLGDGHTTPSFRGAFAKRRAIIPVEAFFEWRRVRDRMPVILEQADWPLWLGEAEGDVSALLRLRTTGCYGSGHQHGGLTSCGTMGRTY
jgi:hypothetical protein